jgi:actin related protein 2/3 complex subunit 2
MKFISAQNEIVRVCFKQRLKEVEQARNSKKKLQWIERNFTEFDGTRFKISSVAKDKQHMLNLSVSVPYYKDLAKFDPMTHLSKIYGDRLQKESEMNFDFTIQTDLSDEKVEWDDLFTQLASVKRNAFACVCEKMFDSSLAGKEEAAEISITNKDKLYLCAKKDRVLFIFSLNIDIDAVLTELFLNEMVDSRKKPDLSACPQVNYVKKAPIDLKEFDTGDGTFFIFTLFQRHFKGKKMDSAIDLMCEFRTYLSYHVKCAKAHIHCRMRTKTEGWKKVMARANVETTKKRRK